MTSVLTLVGDFVLQGAVTARDTVIMKTVPPDRGVLERVTATASALITVVLLTLTIFIIPVAWRLRRTYAKVDHLLERIHDDIAPIMANAHEISDNVNYITTSIRTDVAKLNDTINSANSRLQRAMALSEKRVNEFNALLAIVQQEAEGVFLSTASTVRGVRRGAAAFQDGGGMDLASDELDAADVADELEFPEESDGNDSRTESPADAGPAAPRVRPRPRSPRRA